MVLDSNDSPPEESFEQMAVKAESEMNTEEDVRLPVKRATVLWERTLEDVMEDEEEGEGEELEEDGSGMYEVNSVAETRLDREAEPEEMPDQVGDEDSDIVIEKEKYQVCPYWQEKLCESVAAKRRNAGKIRATELIWGVYSPLL